MRKVKIIAICLAIMLAVSGMAFSVETQAEEMMIATAFEPGHLLMDMGEKFRELVEEETDRLDIVFSAGGAMGNETELAEQASVGAIEATLAGSLPIQVFADEHYYIGTPYVLQDWNHFRNLWEGNVGDKIREDMIEKGNLLPINAIYRGMRQTTSDIPFRNQQEFEEANIALRLPEIPTWVATWEAMGADVTPVALDELFTALQMGVAEASEGDHTQITAFDLQEVQDYLIMTNHHLEIGILYINNEWFEALDEELQQIIKNAAEEAAEYATELSMEREEESWSELEAAGMEIIRDVDEESFRELGEPVVIEMFEDRWPPVTYEEILEYVD